MGGGQSYAEANEALRKGSKVRRLAWTTNPRSNSSDIFIFLVDGYRIPEPAKGSRYNEVALAGPVVVKPRIDMKCADGEIQCGWQPTGEDVLADDWTVVS